MKLLRRQDHLKGYLQYPKKEVLMVVAAGMVKRFRCEGQERQESGVTKVWRLADRKEGGSTDEQQQDDQGQSRRAQVLSVTDAGRTPHGRGQFQTGA